MSKIFKADEIKLKEPLVLPKNLKDKVLQDSILKNSDMPTEKDKKIAIDKIREEYERVIADLKNDFNKEKQQLINQYNERIQDLEHQLDAKFNEGKRVGEIEGIKKGKQTIKEIDNLLKQIVENLNTKMPQIQSEYEDDLLLLIKEIVKFVIKKEIEFNDEIIKNMLHEVVKIASNKKKIFVKANSEIIKFLRNDEEELLANLEGVKLIEFEASNNLEKGDIIVSTETETLDARIDVILDEIFNKIIEIHHTDD